MGFQEEFGFQEVVLPEVGFQQASGFLQADFRFGQVDKAATGHRFWA